jgi:antitoxin component of RelBE/YafQ-DinJ toxin-antitoxin module
MPISLRLDDALSDQLDRASAALGIPKSTLIRRGIEEVLRTVSAPSAQALYEQTSPTGVDVSKSTLSQATKEMRMHKLAFRQAMANKQASRLARAGAGAARSASGRKTSANQSRA